MCAVDFVELIQTPPTLWKCPPPRISKPEQTICSGEKGLPLSFLATPSRNGRRMATSLLTPGLENLYRCLNSLSGSWYGSSLILCLLRALWTTLTGWARLLIATICKISLISWFIVLKCKHNTIKRNHSY